MAKRLFASLLALLLLLVCLPVSADGGDQAQDLIAGIERYKGAEDRQAWLDGELTDAAGRGAEWYALALIKRYPTLDYTRYEAALRATLESGTVASPVSRMNLALVLACLGSSPELVRETLDRGIGQLGIMSWIYGLHLLNAGIESTDYTAADAVGELLALQKDDGGWALSGQYGDVDVTAMALQALAPNRDLPGVPEAIDGALVLLAGRQLEGGGFKSYGVENAESSAMVLLALSCLGVSAEDAGFAGGLPHLYEGLTQFATVSGGFCHKNDGTVNELATAQVYAAISAQIATKDGESSLFLPNAKPGSFVPTVSDGRSPYLTLYISVPVLGVYAAVFVILRFAIRFFSVLILAVLFAVFVVLRRRRESAAKR